MNLPLTIMATELVISNNGSDSTNEVSVSNQAETQVTQTNESQITNDIDSQTNSGGNQASENQTEAEITTGDTTSITSAENQTNINTATVGCCDENTIQAKVTGNASGSESTIDINSSSTNTYTGTQNVVITNTIIGSASTGNNSANYNTNGSVSIQTGDINAVTSVNNSPVNIAQVNISDQSSNITALITGNGSGSKNNINSISIIANNVFTNFSADITNFILWDLETGNNTANGNFGGDVKIKTGDIDLNVFINNLVNLGGVKIDCCKKFDNSQPEDPVDPIEEIRNVGGSSAGGSGSILPAAAAIEAGGAGIYGLSDTSGDGNSIIFWVALVMIAIGGKILVDEIFPVKFAIKQINIIK